MKKGETSIGQKIGLITLGIILVLVCIEFFLRISGVVFLLYREGFDRNLKCESNSYKILCLGDSFTLGVGASKGEDYPRQLEKMLNRNKFKKEFLVINKGRGGQNSSELLYSLDRNLDKYNPDLVVIMIGMNDSHNTHLHNWALGQKEWNARLTSWIKGLRVYKLFNFVQLSIKKSSNGDKLAQGHDLNRKDEFEERNEIVYASPSVGLKKQGKLIMDRAMRFFENNQSEKARVLLMETVNSENVWEYINLAKKYNSYGTVEHIIKKVLRTEPHDEWLRFTLGRIYEVQHKLDKAEKVFKYILENNPSNNYIRFDLAELYIHQKQFDKAESILQDAIKVHGESLRAYTLFFHCYRAQGREKEADRLKEKIILYKGITDLNMFAIKRKIANRRIKPIIMNYPRGNYISEDTAQRITFFVDNRRVFNNISENKRVRLFSADNHHCNAEGYKIIAENVLNVF